MGWSIADHIRTELVVDALEMPPLAAITRRHHRPRRPRNQYTSWVFGHRLREASLLGSMGQVASSVDNALVESSWSTRQREFLDRQHWTSRVELVSAIFERIDGWYNPRRRRTSLGMLAPHEFETLHGTAVTAA